MKWSTEFVFYQRHAGARLFHSDPFQAILEVGGSFVYSRLWHICPAFNSSYDLVTDLNNLLSECSTVTSQEALEDPPRINTRKPLLWRSSWHTLQGARFSLLIKLLTPGARGYWGSLFTFVESFCSSGMPHRPPYHQGELEESLQGNPFKSWFSSLERTWKECGLGLRRWWGPSTRSTKLPFR